MSETEIRRLSEQRASRINRREFDGMASEFYADDAVVMPSAAGEIRGLPDIRAWWRETPQMGLVSLSLETRDIEASGGLAYERGHFVRTLRPKHGAPFQERGKYLVVYRAGEDGWKAVAEIFNSDAPR